MSVTEVKLVAPNYSLKGTFYGVGSVSGDSTSIAFEMRGSAQVLCPDDITDTTVFPSTAVVNGVTRYLTWTVISREKYVLIPAGYYNGVYMGEVSKMVITKARTQYLSVSEPFFPLVFTSSGETYNSTFSFYNLSYNGLSSSPTDKPIDGNTAITVTGGATTSDGKNYYTWTLGTRTYTYNPSAGTYTSVYTPPAAWCDQISTSSTAVMTVTCVVKFGTKTYRTLTTTFNVTVPSGFQPSITAVSLQDKTDTPVPSAWGSVFVQSKSGLRIASISCTPSEGASLTYIILEVGEQTTGRIAYDPSALPQIDVITQSGALPVKVTIIDSRGRSTYQTATLNFLPYFVPQISDVLSSRCDSSGIDDNDGEYFLGTAKVNFATCNGLNSITLQCQWKRTDQSSFGTPDTIASNITTPIPYVGAKVMGGGNIDTDYSYDMKYILTDAFSTVTFIDYLSTAIFLMHFLHGGRGVAFGQKATVPDCMDCAFDAHFRQQSVFDDEVTFTYTDDNSQVQTITMTEILQLLGVISAT